MSKSFDEIRFDCLTLAAGMLPDHARSRSDIVIAMAQQFTDFVIEGKVPPLAGPVDAPKAKVEKVPRRPAEDAPTPEPKKAEPPPLLEKQAVVTEDNDADARNAKITDLLSSLSPDHRIVMKALLGRVKTPHLDAAFKQYLPSVLKN